MSEVEMTSGSKSEQIFYLQVNAIKMSDIKCAILAGSKMFFENF